MEIWLLDGAVIAALLGAYFDVISARIPNRLTYPAIVLGLILRLVFLGWRGLGSGVLGLLVCGGLFFILFAIRALGGGDVKLMATVGAWIGVGHTGTALIVCAIAGGIIAMGYVVLHKRYQTTFSNVASIMKFHAVSGVKPHPEINLSSAKAVRMPYGVAIAAGAVATLITTIWKG